MALSFIYIVVLASAICNNLLLAPRGWNVGITKDTNAHNRKVKLKRSKSSVQYYSNHCASYQIILSGDIEPNPP